MSKIDRTIGILCSVPTVVSGVVLVFLVFLVSAYIFVREFLDVSWLFVEEWSGYLFVLITYWSFAYALRRGRHINVDLVVRLLSKRTRLWVAGCASLLALTMLGLFLRLSIDRCIYAVEESMRSFFPSLTPMWIPFAFVTIGLSIFTLAMALDVVFKVRAAVRGAEEEEEKAFI